MSSPPLERLTGVPPSAFTETKPRLRPDTLPADAEGRARRAGASRGGRPPRPSADHPAVSVVVPTHNRAALLTRCLECLRDQRGVDFEVIVVDDASPDVTPAVVAEATARPWARPLRCRRLPVNGGPAVARNRGIALARGAVVAFTDDDCEPADSWLASLVAALDAAPRDVAGVGGRVLPAEPAGLIARYMTWHAILEPPSSVEYLVTANCAYRRRALLEVCGFNETVRTPGGEDPGLSYALAERGYRFRFVPGAVVRHRYRESVRDFVRTFVRYGRGCAVVLDA